VRVAVLPREVSARVITNALARTAGAVNAVSLGLAIPMLIEFFAIRGLTQYLPVPLGILLLLLGLVIATAIRPTRVALIVFLVVGTVGAVLFEVLLISVYPGILQEGLYLLNRPAVALVLVSFTATTVRAGLVWTLVGFTLSNVVTLLVSIIAGVPFTPGFGPFFTLLLMLLCFGSLAAIQASLRRRVPDFDELESQILMATLNEDLRARVTAAVHDTLLNDLAIVMNAPDVLDDRMRARLRADVATLTSADWLRESSEVVVDDQDADLRNKVMLLVSEMQWRGLTVHITGSGPGIYRLAPGAPEVLLDVVRACLENVLQHSGANVAELDLAYTAQGVTVVVADQGRGFAMEDVAEDRLGLRASVLQRIKTIGGTAKVWSTPGEGTSVVLSIPVDKVITRNEGD
jgi:signal transduction histidine kinase